MRRSRALRAACPRLFRDLAAVLTGLRPAFMLDYGVLAPADLAAAAAELAAVLRLPPSGLLVATLNDCCYLVRPGLLADPAGAPGAGAGPAADGQAIAAAAASTPAAAVAAAAASIQQPATAGAANTQEPAAPAPVMLAACESQLPRWVAGAEAAAACAQLSLLLHALQAAVERHAARGGSGTGGSIPVVDAAELPGCQSLVPPTISGWLLGYPALYLAGSLEEAQATSRRLSCSSLCLHTVPCGLPAVPGVPAPEGQPLLAFSVPAELAAAAEWEACCAAWWACLRRRHQAAARLVGWGEPQLHVAAQAPRPVAL